MLKYLLNLFTKAPAPQPKATLTKEELKAYRWLNGDRA